MLPINFTLVATPEPGTLVLVGAGLALVFRRGARFNSDGAEKAAQPKAYSTAAVNG